MSEQTMSATHHEVGEFVAAVRRHLADLPAAEQQELTEGLEADLSEQVAEQETASLGDPAAYASELRRAAGLAPVGAGRRSRGVGDLLDGAHGAWDRWLAAGPGDLAGLVVALQPVWWLLRAWAALALVLWLAGHSQDLAIVPAPSGNTAVGLVLLLGLLVGSVQVGRGRWWPGIGRRGASGSGSARRVVLPGLNLLAAVSLLLLAGSAQITGAQVDRIVSSAARASTSGPGLSLDGRAVENLYPYDAQGHPLVGVQLVDQDGRAVGVYDDQDALTPWTDADDADLYDVFPLPSKIIDASGNVHGDARIRPPYRGLKPVTLPGFVASVLTQPGRSSAQTTAKPDQPPRKSPGQ